MNPVVSQTNWSDVPNQDLASLLERMLQLHAKMAELTVKKKLAQARLHMLIQTTAGDR